ncbi:MAG: AsmA family protein [Pseudorhodoplanes sp.]
MSAATGFKRLGLAVVALVLALFGTLGVVSLLLPAEQVREAVKAEIRAVTGLDPVLRGDVSVSLFPSGSVSFSDVALGDPAAAEPPLAADRLTAKLRFFPLLMGKIEVADVALDNPRIEIVVRADGRSNWSPLLGSLTRTLAPGAARAEKVVSFSEIRMSGGTIRVRDELRGITERFDKVELSLAWPAISRSFAATGTVMWRNEPMEVGITVGDFAAALQGERSVIKLRASGPPIKFAFDGSYSMRPTVKVEGSVSADAPSLRRAIVWAGQKPLAGGGFGLFSLKAQTNVVGGTIALTGVNLELDGNVAEGVLTFATDGRQTLQGTLASDSIDLSPYLSTVRLMADREREWSRAPISLDGLSTVDLDLRISAAKIAVAGTKAGRTAVGLNLRDGNLTVTIGESQAFGGVIRGSLALSRLQNGASFKSQLQFSNVDLESCIGDLFGIRRIEGKGDLTFALDAVGGSVLALTRSLDGTASIAGRNGALTGLNVEQLLRRLERRPLSAGTEFRTGRTPFERLGVTLKIVDGTADVENVTLEGAAVRLGLAGSASIPARDLDLRGTARLAAATDGKGSFELPFVVQGPWDDPIMLPDPEVLIRRSGAVAPFLDALKNRREREAARPAVEAPNPAPAAIQPPTPAPPAATTPAIEPAARAAEAQGAGERTEIRAVESPASAPETAPPAEAAPQTENAPAERAEPAAEKPVQ